MYNRIKSFLFLSVFLVLLIAAGCKKGTFDINSPNPNVPSVVSPRFVLSAALANSGSLMLGGDEDFANLYMGYWAVSGDYIPTSTTLTYNTTTDYYAGNWDGGFLTLKDYRYIEQLSTDPNQVNYVAIAKIMEAFHFGRIVDMYNNVPYSDALNGGIQNFPKYDDAKAIYASLVKQLDSAVNLINTAPPTAENPGKYDIMFQGKMSNWILFAHTVKLKILMNLTQESDGPAAITAGLSGLTTADFIPAGMDATINPGYSNAVTPQQSPFWQDLGFAPSGAVQGNESYYRACSYAVNFYQNTNDPRDSAIYAPNSAHAVVGRAFGSVGASEHNTTIAGMGPGLLKAPTMPAVILSASESLFLQAEAAQRGYLSGDPVALFQSAVTESFRYLAVPNYQAAATAYYMQTDARVNITVGGNPIQTIILQKWAALNGIDPVESWSDWRRLSIPADLPVSIYPGTTATHVPFRLLYPTSEYSYNGTNVNAQGTINNLTSKIFWMP